MRCHFRSLLIGSAALLLQSAGTAHAAEVVLPPVSDNAALQYWQAIAMMPALDETQRELLNDWDTLPLDDTTKKLLDDSRVSLMFLKRASKLSKCDWGFDYNDGVELYLPHLAPGRNLARIAALDARRALAANDRQAAFDDVIAMLAFGRQAARDFTLVSALVSFSVESVATELLARHLHEWDLKSDEVAQAFATLQPGPSLAHSVRCEQRMAQTLLAQIDRMAARDGGTWQEVWHKLTNNDVPASLRDIKNPAELSKLIDDFQSTYDELEHIVNLPPREFDAKYPEFSERARAANPMAGMLLPSMENVVATQRRVEARRQMLLAAIAIVEKGADVLPQFKDPFGDGPFEYRDTPHGFTLTSALLEKGKPVTLEVGPKE